MSILRLLFLIAPVLREIHNWVFKSMCLSFCLDIWTQNEALNLPESAPKVPAQQHEHIPQLVCANVVQGAQPGITAAEEHLGKPCPALQSDIKPRKLTIPWDPLTFHLQVKFSQWCSRCHMNIMKLIKDLGQLLLLGGGFLLFSAKQQLELERRKSGCQVRVRNLNDLF